MFNDEVERRGVAVPLNEADLSQSSIPFFASEMRPAIARTENGYHQSANVESHPYPDHQGPPWPTEDDTRGSLEPIVRAAPTSTLGAADHAAPTIIPPQLWHRGKLPSKEISQTTEFGYSARA